LQYRGFEGSKASICSKDKIGLSRMHCGKLANKREANARESVQRKKRGGEQEEERNQGCRRDERYIRTILFRHFSQI